MKIKEPALWEACKYICSHPKELQQKIKRLVDKLKKENND